MFDKNMGFFTNGTNFKKTTNGGITWLDIQGGPYTDIYFIDSLNGWMSQGSLQRTIDGGINWVTLPMIPRGGIILASGVGNFRNVNKDTIWGVGAVAFYGSGRFRGLIYKTTNSGLTWGYQQPDTSIMIGQYKYIDFVNKLNGWSYYAFGGVHSVIGGLDSTIFVSVNQNGKIVPINFILYQNYPNPFNPKTIISYELQVTSSIQLKIYNSIGEEIQSLVSQRQKAGEYKIEFDGSGLNSGVYFYKLDVSDGKSNSIFNLTRKMLLIK